MKKILLVGIVVAMTVAVQADIYTKYVSTFGFEANGGGPLLADGDQAWIQLIYAGANGVVDGAATPGGGIQGLIDDQVIFEGLTPVAVGGDFNFEYGLFSEIVGPVAGIAGGNIYGRIFQDRTVAADSWYYEGHLQAMSNFIPPAGAPPLPDETYNLGQGGAVSVNLQVVPEPATLGMMAVAGLGMFLARKKARR